MRQRQRSIQTPPRRAADVRERIRVLQHAIGGWSASTLPIDEIVAALVQLMGHHDPTLPQHGERTAGYAVALGEARGLADPELRDLRRAALLHDLGRLVLPEALVMAPGPLTGDEYALVQSHPRAGAELLEPFSSLRTPALWIAHHHERWDGWGYPYGLPGAFIPLGARILAVADTFDALSAPAWSGEPAGMDSCSAFRVLRGCAGTQLDPDLVQRFVALGWCRRETPRDLSRHRCP